MKLFYRRYGGGPALIILHGLYGSSDNWITVAGRLSGKLSVFLPDMRNHGQSPHSKVHTYDSMADDLFELTGHLGLEKVILAGHSMGGKVAMRFALKWPEKINSLVIIDISPFGSSDTENIFYLQHKEILDALLSLKITGIRSRDEAEKILAERIDSERTRGFLLKNLKRSPDGTFSLKLNAETLLNSLSVITGGVIGPGEEELQAAGFPVTFIKAENSEYLHAGDINKISRIFPAAEMVVVENAGHWIHSDRPDAIVDILLGQLNQ